MLSASLSASPGGFSPSRGSPGMSAGGAGEVRPKALVLGNGVMGLTTAFELAKQGFEVTMATQQPDIYTSKISSVADTDRISAVMDSCASAIAGGWWYPYQCGSTPPDKVALWALSTLERYVDQLQFFENQSIMMNELDNTKVVKDGAVLGQCVEEIPSLIVRSREADGQDHDSSEEDEMNGGPSHQKKASSMMWTKQKQYLHKFRKNLTRDAAERLLFEYFRKKGARWERIEEDAQQPLFKAGKISKMEKQKMYTLDQLREQKKARIAEKEEERKRIEVEEEEQRKAEEQAKQEAADGAVAPDVGQGGTAKNGVAGGASAPSGRALPALQGDNEDGSKVLPLSRQDKKKLKLVSDAFAQAKAVKEKRPGARKEKMKGMSPEERSAFLQNEGRGNLHDLVAAHEQFCPELPTGFFNADFFVSVVVDTPLYLYNLEKILKKLQVKIFHDCKLQNANEVLEVLEKGPRVLKERQKYQRGSQKEGYGAGSGSLLERIPGVDDDVDDKVDLNIKNGASSTKRAHHFDCVVNCLGLFGAEVKELLDAEDVDPICSRKEPVVRKENASQRWQRMLDDQMRRIAKESESGQPRSGPRVLLPPSMTYDDMVGDDEDRVDALKAEVVPSYGGISLYPRPHGVKVEGRRRFPPYACVKISAHDGMVARKHMLTELFPGYVIPRGDFVVCGGSCVQKGRSPDEDAKIEPFFYKKLGLGIMKKLKGKKNTGAAVLSLAESEQVRLAQVAENFLPEALGGRGLDEKMPKEKSEPLFHKIGLRPVREAGVKCDVDDFMCARLDTVWADNYGHGGAGWTMCWGCAEELAAAVYKTVMTRKKQNKVTGSADLLDAQRGSTSSAAVNGGSGSPIIISSERPAATASNRNRQGISKLNLAKLG
ncbi:unnamed protein product [Amoebophrya sp. A25]|nr:unnamed protein product [Amoebophrya sp. A25]|eukprot:GSA25T00026454001.1